MALVCIKTGRYVCLQCLCFLVRAMSLSTRNGAVGKQGEVKVLLFNLSEGFFKAEPGDRIAQVTHTVFLARSLIFKIDIASVRLGQYQCTPPHKSI